MPVFFLIALLAIPSITYAETPKVVSLPEIVVEGKRLRGDHRSAIVLTSKELAREAGRPIGEVLREAAGVDATLGTTGNSNVLIRGSSGSQVLVIIDGVKANDPSASNRYFDWSRIDPTQIERIEILKGPQAVSYGSDSIGGVVLIRTKRDRDAFTAQVEGGSQGFLRARAGLGRPLSENHSIRVQALGKGVFYGDSSAIEPGATPAFEGDDLREGSIGIELASDWKKTMRSTLSADLRAAREEIDAGAFDDDPNYVARTREIRSSLRLEGRFEGFSDWSLLASHLDFRRSYADAADPAHPFSSHSVYRGQNSRGEFQLHSFAEAPFEWVLGSEATRETLANDSANDSTSSYSAFGESNLPLISNGDRYLLASDLGARFSHFTSYGNQANGKWGLSSWLSDEFEADLGISSGFKAPSLFSLYDPLSGNPDLKPEESVQFEIGFTHTPTSELRFSVRAFHSRVRNRFGFGPAPNYRSVNIARAEVDGIEFENETRFSRSFRFRPSLTYLSTLDRSTMRPLGDVPRWKGSAKFEWDPTDDTSLIASIVAKSSRGSSAGGNQVGGFSRVDLTGRKRIGRNWTGTVRVENAFDRDYQEIRGYTTPGISAFVGAEYRSD